MKFILRTLLAIFLILVGAFSGLCIIFGFPDFLTSVKGVFSSTNAESVGYHIGVIIAMLIFVAITFFTIRTAIRIFIKSKKMKSEFTGDIDILDDMK